MTGHVQSESSVTLLRKPRSPWSGIRNSLRRFVMDWAGPVAWICFRRAVFPSPSTSRSKSMALEALRQRRLKTAQPSRSLRHPARPPATQSQIPLGRVAAAAQLRHDPLDPGSQPRPSSFNRACRPDRGSLHNCLRHKLSWTPNRLVCKRHKCVYFQIYANRYALDRASPCFPVPARACVGGTIGVIMLPS